MKEKQNQNLTARNKMKSQTENRRTITIIVTNDKKWFHFTSILQSAGTNECTPTEDRVGGPIYNLWFPVVGADLFTTVEAVLQRHDIAQNLTSLELALFGDYIATYNAKGA